MGGSTYRLSIESWLEMARLLTYQARYPHPRSSCLADHGERGAQRGTSPCTIDRILLPSTPSAAPTDVEISLRFANDVEDRPSSLLISSLNPKSHTRAATSRLSTLGHRSHIRPNNGRGPRRARPYLCSAQCIRGCPRDHLSTQYNNTTRHEGARTRPPNSIN